MLETFILSIAINLTDCRTNEVKVTTRYGYICLTKEQATKFYPKK